jgi:arabinose-5-phosphate isomerase
MKVVPVRDDVDAATLLEWGRHVIARESDALRDLAASLDGSFVEVVRALGDALERGGRILVSGMGKSGLAGRKFVGTLCSTGAPAVFVHPEEAAHGDLGLIAAGDVLIAISRSGDVESLGPVVAAAERLGVPVVAWTAVEGSPLAAVSDLAVVLEVGPEADPDDLIPSTSSTAVVALGDAVAIALFRARGLRADDFARLHPAGALGRRLTLRVADLMHGGESLPVVPAGATLLESLPVITDKRLGVAVVTDAAGELAGVLTDGDLRRALQANPDSLHEDVARHMTRDPRTVEKGMLVARALELMERPSRRITALVVTEGKRPVGVLHLHDCLQAGLR